MSDDVIKNPNRAIPPSKPQFEPEHVRLGKDPLPMVASVDDTLVDDEGTETKHSYDHVIDNNDYVDFFTSPYAESANRETPQPKASEPRSSSPQVGDYILMVFGKLISTGTLKEIELKIREIMYGEDKDFSGMQINTDDIVVLKRVPIKVGIFVDG